MLTGRRLALAVFAAAAFGGGVLVAACGLTITGASDGPPAPEHEAAVLPPGTSTPEPHDSGPPDVGDAGDAGDAARVNPCPADAGLQGSTMVESPSGDFCIDSSEATIADYRAFLDAGPGDVLAMKLPSECVPLGPLDPMPPLPLPDAGKEGVAIRGVNYCDAILFCRWAGKHVCHGGLATDAGVAGEWFRACTNDGAQPLSYGLTPQKDACVFGEPPPAGPFKPGTKASCVGGYSGVLDLLGNVAEWVDTCDDKNCSRAGGYWSDDGQSVTCTLQEPVAITFKSEVTGIRCCR